MRTDFRLLRDDGDVNMIDDTAAFHDEFRCMSKKQVGRRALPLRVQWREVLADVTEPCRSQQCVGNGMKDYIGIAVSSEPAAMSHGDSTKHDRSLTGKGV